MWIEKKGLKNIGFYLRGNGAVKKNLNQHIQPNRINEGCEYGVYFFKIKLKQGNGFTWRAMVRLTGYPVVCESFERK